MRRALPAVAVSAILASAASTVLADNARFSGPYGTGGSYNVYEFVRTSRTWDEARASAATSSFNGVPGHLATVHSANENSFIYNFNGRGGDWWLGLTDSTSVSTIDGASFPGAAESGATPPASRGPGWVWVTGEPYSFSNWGDGEPNDWNGDPRVEGAPGEDATHIRGDSLWNDNTAGPTLGERAGTSFWYV